MWNVSSLQRKPKGSVDAKEAGDPTEAVMWMGPERDLGVRQKKARLKEGRRSGWWRIVRGMGPWPA